MDSYRYDEPVSVFKTFEQFPFYSLMHDGISKFGVEYNGVYLRGTNSDQETGFVPYCLSKMKGGVTGLDTAHEIISNVAEIMSCNDSAFATVGKSL